MTSNIWVYATLKEMEFLFDWDNAKNYSIRFYEGLDYIDFKKGIYKFKVIVRHADKIGYKDGQTFNYESFIDTFEKLNRRAKK